MGWNLLEDPLFWFLGFLMFYLVVPFVCYLLYGVFYIFINLDDFRTWKKEQKEIVDRR
mgnify:CR=1 FL=1